MTFLGLFSKGVSIILLEIFQKLHLQFFLIKEGDFVSEINVLITTVSNIETSLNDSDF